MMVILLSLTSPCAVPLSQPSFLHQVVVQGWLLLLGRGSKDEKHLAVVEKVGSDFIPLVVESFEVWTPLALKIIHLFADCTAP